MKKWILVLCVLSLAIAGGCVALSRTITPASIDPRAVEYVVDAGVGEPNDYKSFIWPNLADAEKLEADVNSAHEILQLSFQQKIESDTVQYSQLTESVMQNRQDAQLREKTIFGPQGLLAIGLSSAGFGGLCGLIGLMRKRPQDYTAEDVQQIEKTLVSEGVVTEKALTETVKAIELVKDLLPDEYRQEIKALLGQEQSADSKVEIAKIKKS